MWHANYLQQVSTSYSKLRREFYRADNGLEMSSARDAHLMLQLAEDYYSSTLASSYWFEWAVAFGMADLSSPASTYKELHK